VGGRGIHRRGIPHIPNDPDSHPLGDIRVTRRHASLNGDRGRDRVDNAREFREEPVSCHLEDAAPVRREHGIDQGAAMVLEIVPTSSAPISRE